MHAILFSLPGSPVLYYGDEIAMGDNVYLGDRDGVRTPMQWTGDRNGGFSRADFAQLYAPPLMDPVYGYQAVNVEAQLRTPTSLLRWLRRFISLRKEHPVFGFGTFEPLEPSNPRIFAHVRRYEDDVMLCVHNLARSAQAVELDLSRVRGPPPGGDLRPLALPGDRPVAVPAHARAARLLLVPARRGRAPTMSEAGRIVAALPEERLHEWVLEQRWFASKAREVAHLGVLEAVTLREESPGLVLALVEARFHTGTHELYQVPLGLRPDDEEWDERVIAEVEGWTIYDALADPAHGPRAAAPLRGSADVAGEHGSIRFRWAENAAAGARGDVDVRPVGVEQSNSSVVFGDELILKVFRRLEPGVNPELELLRFLSERGFEHIAPLAGWYEYAGRLVNATLGTLQEYLTRRARRLGAVPGRPRGLRAARARPRRGHRPAAHAAWARRRATPTSRPEEPSTESLSLLTATVDEEIERMFVDLDYDDPALAPARRPRPRRARAAAGALAHRRRRAPDPHARRLPPRPDDADRPRLGDPRLRGRAGALAARAPAQALAAARRRGHAALVRLRGVGRRAAERRRRRRRAGRSARAQSFLDGYFETVDSTLLPHGQEAAGKLLSMFELEKAVYELRYELNNRPDWVGIPVAGIERLLDSDDEPG